MHFFKKPLVIALLCVIAVVAIGWIISRMRPIKPDGIRVTAVLNTSGKLSAIGEPTRKLLEVFESRYNEAHSNAQLEIRFENAASDPSRATDAVTKALSGSQQPHILISSTSGTTMAILPYVKNQNLLLIANAGHPGIVSDDVRNSLIAFPAPEDECAVITQSILPTEEVFLVRSNDIYHDLDAVQLKRSLGDRLVGDERYTPGQNDFTDIAERISDKKPSVVVLMGFGISYRSLMMEMLDRELPQRLIVDTDFLSVALQEYPKEMLERITFVGTDTVDKVNGAPKVIRETLDTYRKDYEEEPMYYAVILIDALWTAIESRDENTEIMIQNIENRAQTQLGSGMVGFQKRKIRIGLSLFHVTEGKIARGARPSP